MRRRLVLAGLAALLLRPGAALGHAVLVKSVPAQRAALLEPPPRVELWFNERLEPASAERCFLLPGVPTPVGIGLELRELLEHLAALRDSAGRFEQRRELARGAENDRSLETLQGHDALIKIDRPHRRRERGREPRVATSRSAGASATGGSMLFIINTGYHGAYPSVAVNIVWAAIAVRTLARAPRAATPNDTP